LSPQTYRPRQLGILENVQSGTGTWFLGHPSFKRWLYGDVEVLWCPGISGAGKTCLMSLVIDHLERQNAAPGNVWAYIYCDYSRRQEQAPAALLSSMLQQVVQRRTTKALPAEVLSLHQGHKKHGTRPTLAQVTATLRALTAPLATFHVVVDALDECTESEEDALRFISAVRSLGSSVKLLCTSRFSSIFGNYFDSAVKLEISAQSGDIGIFLESQLQARTVLMSIVTPSAAQHPCSAHILPPITNTHFPRSYHRTRSLKGGIKKEFRHISEVRQSACVKVPRLNA
ncbi:uncharacterized protein B0T15DRAFT_396946, partial [Chaetomium strumarium]